MVNEQRLQHMIRMSMFDENEGRKCKPMIQYARKDYVSLELLKSFVTGTLCYALLFGLWCLYFMERLMDEINQMDIPGFLVMVLVAYLVFLLCYLLATYVVYQLRYTAGRKKVKQYYSSVKKVNQMYEREERLRNPGSRDWD